MGFGGIGIWQLLIILVIVLLLFGTKRLKSIGSDLGNAVKGFRSAMGEREEEAPEPKKLETEKKTEEGTAERGAEGKAPSAATAVKDKERV